MSPEPLSHWTKEPFGAQIQGDRMYGLGTLDMKGGFAAAIFALEALGVAGVGLRGNVVVQSVFDEECSGNGTLAVLDRGHLGDAAIIAEPTEQTVVWAYVGVMWARITVRGRGAHAETASAAVNAIDNTRYAVQQPVSRTSVSLLVIRRLKIQSRRKMRSLYGPVTLRLTISQKFARPESTIATTVGFRL